MIVPPCLLNERSTEQCQQLLSFFIGLGSGNEVDIHTSNLVNLIVFDFRENQLFLDTGGVVTLTVEGVAVDSSEVTNTREAYIKLLVNEFIHLFSS